MNECFQITQSPDLADIQKEIEQLQYEVTALGTPTPLPFALPVVQPLVIVDLFVKDNPPPALTKSPRTDDDMLSDLRFAQEIKGTGILRQPDMHQ